MYVKVPIQECWDETGKQPIGTRWVDVNKGDDINPEYRSRLVAQEVKTSKNDELFAATPPLEAKKMLLSMAVTEGIGFGKGYVKKVDFIDVRRAYFNAAARRTVFVKLPAEDAADGMCGRLLKSMYGTRDAAQNWELEYVAFMKGLGFVASMSSPCLFYHPQRDLRVVIHGDDFTILGEESQLRQFRKEISDRFKVKFRGMLGPQRQDCKEIMILNRTVRWLPLGIQYEAD